MRNKSFNPSLLGVNALGIKNGLNIFTDAVTVPAHPLLVMPCKVNEALLVNGTVLGDSVVVDCSKPEGPHEYETRLIEDDALICMLLPEYISVSAGFIDSTGNIFTDIVIVLELTGPVAQLVPTGFRIQYTWSPSFKLLLTNEFVLLPALVEFTFHT